MNIVEEYKFNKVRIENLKLDIETYENDYLSLGDTKERWDKLEQYKNEFNIMSEFIAAYEKVLPKLSEEEYLFIKYVYFDNKTYKDFAYDLFKINISFNRMNNFCGLYKQYILKKLERLVKNE